MHLVAAARSRSLYGNARKLSLIYAPRAIERVGWKVTRNYTENRHMPECHQEEGTDTRESENELGPRYVCTVHNVCSSS